LELGEQFSPKVVQSLVHRRLVVRIGSKYDVYWDIFRDYLSSGRLPVQENYILRAQVGTVLKVTQLLMGANGTLEILRLQQKTGLSERSFYNVARDMGLLGLAEVHDGLVSLQVELPIKDEEWRPAVRDHLHNRLRRNRLVWRLLEHLEEKDSLAIEEVSCALEASCPYITARRQTWLTYARIFAGWMDAADLAVFNRNKGTLERYEPGTQIRDRELLFARPRGAPIPRIQYSPIETVAIRLVAALQEDRRVDWSDVSRSTIFKSLASLEDLGFIVRGPQSVIRVRETALDFVLDPEKRPTLFAEGAMKMESFAAFIAILEAHKDVGRTLAELGGELKDKLGLDWKLSTAETNAKIMLDWARHTHLAPGVFAARRRRRDKNRDQLSLL
jgi:hypothetical protein